MSMHESAERLRKEFEQEFEGKLTNRQLWFMVKLCKGVRMYARNNAAFNNFFGSVFGKIAGFQQVKKLKPDGGEYMGLQIIMKKPDGSEVVDNSRIESDEE